MARKRAAQRKDRSAGTYSALDLARSALPAEEFALLVAEIERPLLPSLRINRQKLDDAGFDALKARYGWATQPVPFCSQGRWVSAAAVPVSRTVEHRLGFYYIQEAASMLPPELFNFSGQPALILDMAASPGGKTTHLADLTGGHALIVANDSSADRVTALRLVLNNWGAPNTAVTSFPGERFGQWYPDTFDCVLLDAPCSMQGLRGSDSHSPRPITQREISQLASRQTRLLLSALRAVKPGGQVVFSTCTLTAEENEGVLQAVLDACGLETIRIEDLTGLLPAPAPALAGAGTSSAVSGAARLWPHRFGTAGFFAALLTKVAALPDERRNPPARTFEKTGLELLSGARRSGLLNQIQTQFGVDLKPELDEKSLLLAQRQNRLYLLPEHWMTTFSSLPYHALGLPLGEIGLVGIDPALDWLSLHHRQIRPAGYTLPEDLLPAWLRGEDLTLDLRECYQPGQVVPVYDHDARLVGKGKVTARGLRNYLPFGFVQGLA